ncbi:hypothetical protein BBP40_011361 [Aspergillus hancockii]|nr:hypothetical protein BBP40_011361 [Aspergillus hancockii]
MQHHQGDHDQPRLEAELPSSGGNGETTDVEEDSLPYCSFPERRKALVIATVSFAAAISPVSSSIYLPALTALSQEMRVSISLINLSITVFMIFQAIAPSFVGSLSDTHGRRPAYLTSIAVYLSANVGLALQANYASLMVLRCIQACGSSGATALSTAVVADLSTRAERGKYIGYATLGTMLGPLGPIIGGLLNHRLGWRWIFWFLVIFSGAFYLILLVTFPETCRAVVGNGSIQPPRWNRPLWTVLRQCIWPTSQKETNKDPKIASPPCRQPQANPLTAAQIVLEKESGCILIYGALLSCGFHIVLTTLSTQLERWSGFNSIQVGLCYLPFGVGGLTSRWTVGPLLDRNFKRQARSQNMTILKNQQQDIKSFDIERARLQVTLPCVYAGCLTIIAYGWVMRYQTSLAGPLITLFFLGHFTTGAIISLNTLIVDTHKQSPATAIAANNLLRYLLGAGATAIADPLISRIGIGWTGTLIASAWIAASPLIWAVFSCGHRWRNEARAGTEHRRNELV